MSKRLNRSAKWLITTLAVAALAIPACNPTFLSNAGGGGGALGLRIENATASSARVVVDLLDSRGEPIESSQVGSAVDIPVVTITPGSVQYSILTPVGASAQQGAAVTGFLATSSTVQVPGQDTSEGGVFCAPVIRINATIGEGEQAVRLTGDGTGTPGFDSGSVGADGERFLVEGVDYVCGQAAVVRIDDDGATTARGRVAVVNAGSGSPFGSTGFGPSDGSGDGGSGSGGSGGGDMGSNGSSGPDAPPELIRVRIDNRASRIATVDLVVGTTSGDQSFNANVPANEATEGDFTCGTQLTITAGFPDPDTQTVDPDGPQSLVILTGEGTGSEGFDGSSVSLDGKRILVVGTHVDCGDTVLVTLQGDAGGGSAPIGFEGLIVLGGSVEVLGPGESIDDADTLDPTDTLINVVNQTSEFVSVSVFGAVGALVGTQDIFVPPNSQSGGTVACAEGYLVTAKSLTAEALQGLVDEVLIVLTGDGTGSTNFDEGSVGQDGSRLLQQTQHYICGDTITVTVTDPGQPGFTEPSMIDTNGAVTGFTDLNGNGVQDEIPDRLGAGTVEVE